MLPQRVGQKDIAKTSIGDETIVHSCNNQKGSTVPRQLQPAFEVDDGALTLQVIALCGQSLQQYLQCIPFLDAKLADYLAGELSKSVVYQVSHRYEFLVVGIIGIDHSDFI